MKKATVFLIFAVIRMVSYGQIDLGADKTVCLDSCTDLSVSYLGGQNTIDYTVSAITFSPDSIGGTSLGLTDNGQSGLLPIGFDFSFYGNTYSQFIVGANGWISFSSTVANNSLTASIPNTGANNPQNCILGPWMDVNPALGGNIYYQVLGNAPNRRLIVTYEQIPLVSCITSEYTVQIVLYETTNIIENHIIEKPICLTWNSGNAVQGIQNADGSAALAYPGRNNAVWSTANESVRYVPSGSPVTEWYHDQTLIGSGSSINVCPDSTSTYIVNVITDSITTETDTIKVIIANPVVDAGIDLDVCEGDSVVLSGSGTGPGSVYTWNNGIADNISFYPTNTETYHLVGTDINGCSATDSILVSVKPSPTIDAGIDLSVCSGSFVAVYGLGAGPGGTYSWNNGVTDGVPFGPATTDFYTLTGTSSNGCSNMDSILITVLPLPNVSGGPGQTICSGDSTVLSGSGVGAGGNYFWSAGVSDGVYFTPMASNVYHMTAIDSNGCIKTASVNIIVNPLPNINAGTNQTICDGASVLLSGSGAGASGAYVWDNGVINGNSFVPSDSMICYVTGTNNNGCSNRDSLIINVNPLPLVFAGSDQSICQGDSVILNGAGLVPNGTYTWNNGVSDNTYFIPQNTANYILTGTDNNGCNGTDTLNVLVNALPGINAGVDSAICIGDSTILSGTGAGVGGTYIWDNNITNNQFFQPVNSAQYLLTGTDANGCQNKDSVFITINQLPIVDAGVNQVICQNDSLILAGSGLGAGGVYTWGNNITNLTYVTPQASATYHLTGTDFNGCQNNDSVLVTVNLLPIVDAGADQSLCTGDSVLLSGAGAGINGTYQWNNSVVNNVYFTPQFSQTYQLTGTDVNGCQNSDSVVVNVNLLPLIDGGADQVICYGDSAVLSGSGAGLNGNYNWNNSVLDNVYFTPQNTGVYYITGTDANGCNNNDSVLITINALPVIDAGADQVICQGDSVVLTGTGAGLGGTFNWDNGIQDNVAFAPQNSTVYWVTGTDANSCQNTDSVTVLVNSSIIVDAGIDQSVCQGDSIALTGAGAGLNGTYSWDNGVTDGVYFIPQSSIVYHMTGTSSNGCANTDSINITVNTLPQIDAGVNQVICSGDSLMLIGAGAGQNGIYNWDGGVQNNVYFSPLSSAVYHLIGIDSNGCENKDSLNITVNALPQVNAGADMAICIGDSVLFNGNGAGQAAVYTWSNGVSNNSYFSPVNTNTYIVNGVDNNGCESQDSLMIVVNTLPQIDAGTDHTICSGDSIVLSATGGGPNSTYSWDNAVTDNVYFTPQISGFYHVEGIDDNGCANDDSLFVAINALPQIDAGFNQSICFGDSLLLSATGLGMNGNYIWDNNIMNGIYFSPQVSAMYYVSGTDNNGCENTDSVLVTVNQLPQTEAGADLEICLGDSVVLTGTGAGVGAVYTWDNGVQNNTYFMPQTTNMYWLNGVDINGCEYGDSVTVTVKALPQVEAGADQVICNGDNIVLIGSGTATVYNWSNGVTNGLSFSPGSTTLYYVRGMGLNGCENTDSVTVTVNPLPLINAGPDHAVCEGESAYISASGAGINGQYFWGNSVQNNSYFTPLNSTYLTVTGIDDNGCENTDEVYIDVVPYPIADFSFDILDSDVSKTNVRFRNASDYSDDFVWDFGDGDFGYFENEYHTYTLTDTNAFTVELTAKNSLGCEHSTSQIIELNKPLIYYVPNAFTPDDNGLNETLKPIFTSGFDPYDFHMVIFNRWGEIVFESYDSEQGWNGTYGNLNRAQTGVYVWKIDFKLSASDKRIAEEGTVTLIR